MTIQEYIKKVYNLDEGEYRLEDRTEHSECICGKRYLWIDMRYMKKLARPHLAGGRLEKAMKRTFYKEWVNCHCSCGLEWDDHPIFVSVHEPKNWCMAHDGPFENSEDNYNMNGNFCVECSQRQQKNSEIAMRDRSYPQDDPMKMLVGAVGRASVVDDVGARPNVRH